MQCWSVAASRKFTESRRLWIYRPETSLRLVADHKNCVEYLGIKNSAITCQVIAL